MGTPWDSIYDNFWDLCQRIEKFKYMRSTNPGRYLIFFLIKFPVECHQNHVWRPIFDPRFGFLVTNSVVKDQKSPLEMAMWAF